MSSWSYSVIHKHKCLCLVADLSKTFLQMFFKEGKLPTSSFSTHLWSLNQNYECAGLGAKCLKTTYSLRFGLSWESVKLPGNTQCQSFKPKRFSWGWIAWKSPCLCDLWHIIISRKSMYNLYVILKGRPHPFYTSQM